jgi:hypothetical protein
MDEYMKNYPTFTKKMVYRFLPTQYGGIGDCIKFFMFALSLSMQYNIQLYFEKNNSYLEQHLKLKYPSLYIQPSEIVHFCSCNYNEIPNLKENVYNIVTPFTFYNHFNYNTVHMIQDVFYFSDKVISYSSQLCPYSNYISIHLRLGDKFLETDKCYIQCRNDTRHYNEDIICKTIEENKDEPILFFCDNNNYKLKIKNKYSYIHITDTKIGHTSLNNTTEEEIIDAITEFYLISQSTTIYAGSQSGFSIVASKFKNVHCISLY